MGFTLQDTQPPQPPSPAPLTITTNTASDTSTNGQQPATPEDRTPYPAIVVAAAAASPRTSTSGADAALRDVFLATMAAPRLPPWYLGPVEVEGGGAQRRGGAGEPDRSKRGQRKQLVAGKEQQGNREEDEKGADTGAAATAAATTTTTATTPSNRGAASLRTIRTVAAGELLAISVPLGIRYCRSESTPENEELAELMMGAEAGAGPGRGSKGWNLENSFPGLTDLQQSLLGMMWQGHSALPPLTATGSETATNASETRTAESGQVLGPRGGGGGGVGPVKRAFLEMVAQSAEDETAPRAPPLLPAGELYKLVNMNCLGEEFQASDVLDTRSIQAILHAGFLEQWKEGGVEVPMTCVLKQQLHTGYENAIHLHVLTPSPQSIIPASNCASQ